MKATLSKGANRRSLRGKVDYHNRICTLIEQLRLYEWRPKELPEVTHQAATTTTTLAPKANNNYNGNNKLGYLLLPTIRFVPGRQR